MSYVNVALRQHMWIVYHNSGILPTTRFADTNDYIVVSKDIDFRNSYFLRHSPRKLIRIVLGNISNNELIILFVQHLTLFQQYFQQDGYLELDKSSVNIFRESSWGM